LKKILAILSLILSVTFVSAQGDTIVGYAPEYIGQKVTLYTIDDYLTMTRTKLSESVVNPKDSLFKLVNPTKITVKAFIEIDKIETEIYLQPNSSYQIVYPKPEKILSTFVNQKVEAIFYGLDSTDINYKILRYNQWFDKYVAYHRRDITQKGFAPYLDTFKMYAYEAYKNEKNPYMVNYVRYNIALMEQIKAKKSNPNHKINTFLEYIKPYPVYAYNDQYMKFIKGFYPKDFEGYMPEIKSSVYLALNHSSPTRLMRALRKDPYLKDPELREMMMVNMLGHSYYKRGYDRKNIITILDSISHFAKYKTNAIASKNMIEYLTKVEQGYPAPHFTIVQANDTISLSKYAGKFLYVNFYASWNETSVKEMKLIKALKHKYGDYIDFLSFSTDKTFEAFNQFKKEHSDYDWDIVFLDQDVDVINQFNVKAIPAYFLINPEGFIALAPAKSPSPDGEYKSIEETFEYIRSIMKN